MAELSLIIFVSGGVFDHIGFLRKMILKSASLYMCRIKRQPCVVFFVHIYNMVIIYVERFGGCDSVAKAFVS